MKTNTPGPRNEKDSKPPRMIAFYLPQFYPTPYNDEWWGKGFTEWTNVVQARPHFKGHYQPHLPADLGFYDLRLPEAREAQAELARQYGIHGFCYYHYWFNGQRILERPLDAVLASGTPDLPFCICWANEDWSRTWEGHRDKLLLAQSYSPKDDLAHIQYLLPTLSDPRYIQVEGKPLVLIYKVELMPDPKATAELWRREAEKAGLSGLFLVRVESNSVHGNTSPASIGFDAAVRFQPNFTVVHPPTGIKASTGRKIREEYPGLYRFLRRFMPPPPVKDIVYTYENIYRRWRDDPMQPERHFECVTPMWDNSARRHIGATIIMNSTPQLYEQWLREAVARTAPDSAQEKTVFINAWNEWAEGCHLEPCQKWGTAYLEATQRVYRG